ncbi:hypothetical protein R3P38DRAFT_3102727 [Favolaschia claudopus]|uniref:C2H2-type domain-containing protein n=1 Tax=Favolaschia claudopus TaxID=2862362 RepID=A0AAV9ZLF1_9AGAR
MAMAPQYLTQSIDGPAPAGPKNAAMTIPVPVPNLIKKSRGRHVPVGASAGTGEGGSGSGGGKGKGGKGGGGEQERAFVCEVAGCGKGFVRGEHLKRHPFASPSVPRLVPLRVFIISGFRILSTIPFPTLTSETFTPIESKLEESILSVHPFKQAVLVQPPLPPCTVLLPVSSCTHHHPRSLPFLSLLYST